MKASDKTLRKAVAATGTGLLDLYGIGPASAARILGDVADVARFGTRARFASWNGTEPLDASSGAQNRHRLSRAANRRINRALCTSWPIVQIRHDTEGRAYFRRRVAAGKTKMEALRALKRRLSDVVLPPTRRRHPQGEPGRTHGGDYDIQRGRPNSDGRLFGPVTARARHRAYNATPRRPPYPTRRSARTKPAAHGPSPRLTRTGGYP